MADIDEKQQSETTRIVGGDEQYAADVVLDGDGQKKLLVKSDTNISTDLQIVQQSNANIDLPSTNVVLYSVSGNRTVSGFALRFDSNRIAITLEVDSTQIFDLDINDLRRVADWNNASLPNLYVSWNNSLNTFYFTPAFPIEGFAQIRILARSTQGNRRYEDGIIQVA